MVLVSHYRELYAMTCKHRLVCLGLRRHFAGTELLYSLRGKKIEAEG